MQYNLLKAAKACLVAASAALLVACGGGADEPITAQQAANAFKATAKPAAVAAAAIPQRGAPATSAVIAERIFAFAEANPAISALFPAGSTTQQAGPFLFRYYPATGYYLGVVVVAGAGYEFENVYVLGNQFGMDLAHPYHAGPASWFVDVTAPTTGGETTDLTITVSVPMAGVNQSYTLHNVPKPNTQEGFCSGLANDTTFTQITNIPGFSGSFQILNCAYSGNTGNISARLTVSGPISINLDYTITYTFH